MESKEFIEYLRKYFPDMEIITIGLDTKKKKKKARLTSFERNLNGMINTIKDIDISKVTESDNHDIMNTIGCMIACINSYDIDKIHNEKLLIKYNDFLSNTKETIDSIFDRKLEDIKARLLSSKKNTDK